MVEKNYEKQVIYSKSKKNIFNLNIENHPSLSCLFLLDDQKIRSNLNQSQVVSSKIFPSKKFEIDNTFLDLQHGRIKIESCYILLLSHIV